MLQTFPRWLHQQLCPHATWLPCPESPGLPSMVMCPCCGKTRAIERRYQNDGEYQPYHIYVDVDGKVRRFDNLHPPGNE